ncbi:PREDICTED: SCP2 sterol-binding domain-containing protein 1 [Gekko japonicus]|uniref:SCP2 sterol-binding domain-containing protein 1 n=1 Tax=Gekko japonicus TaxID=146911 RepID=A0ABM1JL42_GEKJA|nr:PREDICTED: SCP2 sterol-binding domain-containing protein 1 [Gekko japonicus]
MWKEMKKKCLHAKMKTAEETAASELYMALVVAPKNPPAKAAGLQSDVVFEEIGRRIREVGSQLVQKVNAIFQWDIMSGELMVAQWTLDLKTGSGEIYRGPSRQSASAVFTLSENDFMELVLGKVKPQRAFLGGKIKVKGSILLSHRLEAILKDYIKL